MPAKRHVQTREDGRLLVEEVMGYEGFSGNESILYHRHSPCRIADAGEFTPIVREEWVPDTHVHRLTDTRGVEPGGDPVERPPAAAVERRHRGLGLQADAGAGGLLPQRRGRRGRLRPPRQRRRCARSSAACPYAPGDYVVIPRGTTHRWEPQDGEQVWLCFHTPGEIETPNRYRNRYGQLLEHAPFSQRDFHAPAELETFEDDGGEHEVIVRVRDGYQRYTLDYHPFDVVGWDGYVYPYTFSVHDFEPKAGRLHQPPPAHQTFQGPNFVICSFCPRMLDWDPEAIVLPYHHSNLQSEEAIYYVDGQFGSRKGVDVGTITLHPSGLPHGPQPGLVERSIGVRADRRARGDVGHVPPAAASRAWSETLDDPAYAYSWREDPAREPLASSTG